MYKIETKTIVLLLVLFFFSCSKIEENRNIIPENEYECLTKKMDCRTIDEGMGDTREECTLYYYFGCYKGRFNSEIIIKNDTLNSISNIEVYPEYSSTVEPCNFTSDIFNIEFLPSINFYFLSSNSGFIKYNNKEYIISNCTGYLSEDTLFMKIRAINSSNDTIFSIINSVRNYD